MVASLNAYYIQLLVVYVVTVSSAGVLGGLYYRRQLKRYKAERRRLEYVLRRYNKTFNDNHNPFED